MLVLLNAVRAELIHHHVGVITHDYREMLAPLCWCKQQVERTKERSKREICDFMAKPVTVRGE